VTAAGFSLGSTGSFLRHLADGLLDDAEGDLIDILWTLPRLLDRFGILQVVR